MMGVGIRTLFYKQGGSTLPPDFHRVLRTPEAAVSERFLALHYIAVNPTREILVTLPPYLDDGRRSVSDGRKECWGLPSTETTCDGLLGTREREGEIG